MCRLKFFTGFLIVLVISSCGRYRDIEVGDFQEYKIKGFKDNALIVAMRVPVENPSIHKITIYDLDARMFVNDQYIGKVYSDQKVVLKAKSEEIYDLEFKVRMANFLTTAASMMSLKAGSKIKLRLEGSFMAKSLLIKRKVDIDESQELVL